MNENDELGHEDAAWSADLKISKHVVWRDVEGDLVLFDERSGHYHTLNESASFAWRHIARGCAPTEVLEEAVRTFPESSDAIAHDLADFVGVARALGLLEA